MKIMKKVAATLLGLSMALSFGSCGLLGGDKKDDSNSWNPSNPEIPGSTVVAGEGAKYLEGIVQSVRDAQTISVSTQFDINFETVDKAYGVDPYDDWDDSESVTGNGNMTITATKAGDKYNLSVSGHVFAQNTYFDGYSQETNVTDMPVEFRVVGDMAYMINPEDNKWYKTPIDWDNIMYDLALVGTPAETVLGTIYNTLMKEDLSAVYDLLGPIFEQTLLLDIQNQKYEFELSVADDIMEVLNYITTLDYSQTVLAFLNSILAQEDTSVEEILDEIATVGTMTLQELYDEFNKALVEKTGKDINGLKNELLAKIDLDQFKDYIDQETFTEIEQSLTMISQMKVEEMFADFMPYTINDLITMMYAEDDLSNPITLEMFADELLNTFNTMTLEQALGEDYFDAINELKTLSVNELKQNLSIQFNNYKITNLSYGQGIDFSYNGSEMSIVMDADVSVAINLSSSATSIVAPEGALDMTMNEVIPTSVCINCGNPNIVYEYEGFGFCEECYEICFGS